MGSKKINLSTSQVDRKQRIIKNPTEITRSCENGRIFYLTQTYTVNRSEMGIAESYFTYFLKEDKMAKMWLWVKKEHIRTAFDEGERVSVSGATVCVEKKQAKDFLVRKIVKSWKKKGPYSFNVNASELEAALRKKFLS